jgi:hypothetical protein
MNRPDIGLERAMADAGRPASIDRRPECLAVLALRVIADDNVARHQVDLFAVVMDERRLGVTPGSDLNSRDRLPVFPFSSRLAGIFCLMPAGVCQPEVMFTG